MDLCNSAEYATAMAQAALNDGLDPVAYASNYDQRQEDHAFQRHYWLDASISFFRMMEIVIRKIKNHVKVLPISTEFYTFAENSSFKAKSHEKFNVQILGSLADVVVLCYPCMVAKRVDQL